jgi:hypothetical protein
MRRLALIGAVGVATLLIPGQALAYVPAHGSGTGTVSAATPAALILTDTSDTFSLSNNANDTDNNTTSVANPNVYRVYAQVTATVTSISSNQGGCTASMFTFTANPQSGSVPKKVGNNNGNLTFTFTIRYAASATPACISGTPQPVVGYALT